jgi:hypothetical protein
LSRQFTWEDSVGKGIPHLGRNCGISLKLAHSLFLPGFLYPINKFHVTNKNYKKWHNIILRRFFCGKTGKLSIKELLYALEEYFISNKEELQNCLLY